MLAQAIGRWGNFFNGEAYGYSISAGTSYYFLNTEHVLESGEGTLFNLLRMGVSHNNNTIYRYYHPTFFYECVWNIIGFVLINLFYKRKKFDGQIALMYFVWYGFGRMFIEGFRSDSLYIPGTTLRISQCLGLACVIVGGTLLIVFSILAHKHPKPMFAAVSADAKTGEDVSVPTQTRDSNDETEDHTVDDLLNEMVETVIENIQNEEANTDESAEPKEMEGEDALEPTKEEQNDGKID